MVHLDDEEKGILKYLGKNYDEAINLKDISKYLKSNDYDNSSPKEVREDLDHLIKVGYVRSKTEGKGTDREEKFYLAKFVGGGGREKRKLQGRGFFRDLGKLIERLSGVFFLLSGFGAFVYESSNLTGAVISTTNGVGIVSLLAAALLVIGGFLLKKGLKND